MLRIFFFLPGQIIVMVLEAVERDMVELKIATYSAIKILYLIIAMHMLSISYQFLDIGSHSQLSNEQKRYIYKQTS